MTTPPFNPQPCPPVDPGGPVMASLFNYSTLCDSDPDSGIVHNVITQQVITNDNGDPIGVRYFDATTGAPYELVGEAVDCSVSRGPEIKVLCEYRTDGSVVQFIRRYTELDSGEMLVGDSTLDGDQTYDVDPTSTIGLCMPPATGVCEPVTALGMCLADGTPVAVVLGRDCETGVASLDGYVDLVLGTFTEGPLPDDARPCGRPSVQLVGPLCVSVGDVVVATVTVEYTYGPDNAVTGARLVDTVTGTTYVPPVGATVGACTSPPVVIPPYPDIPAAADALLLCDDDGPFVRDFSREEGVITSVADYTLAGAPYSPVGTVRLCEPDQPVFPEAGPIGVADVCLTNGNPGAVIRNANGTLTYVDLVTGGTVFAAQVRPCPAVPAPTTYAELYDVVPGSPWTDAVVSTRQLESVTVVVITGTATVDGSGSSAPVPVPAGTSLSWSRAAGASALAGPSSVTAAAASRAIVSVTTSSALP